MMYAHSSTFIKSVPKGILQYDLRHKFFGLMRQFLLTFSQVLELFSYKLVRT